MRFYRATEGHRPRLSPNGGLVAFGIDNAFVAGLGTGVEWRLGPGGQCQWIAPDTVAYLESAENGLSALLHTVQLPALSRVRFDEKQDLFAGPEFSAASGHWANALKGRLIYDGDIIVESGASKPRVAGEYLAYIHDDGDKHQIRVQSGGAGIKYTLMYKVHELAIGPDGTVAFTDEHGHVGLIPYGHKFTPYPYQGRERCLTIFELDGRPWIASIQQPEAGDELVVLRDTQRDEFVSFPVPVPGITSMDVAVTDADLIIATASGERLNVRSMTLDSVVGPVTA